MKKRSEKKRLVDKLDDVFSKYIRLRDALPHSGLCACISCGQMHHWTKIQNGHYISRSSMALRWDEDNCHAQCMPCNVFQHGNMLAYRRAMVKKYGEQFVDQLELRGNIETRKWSEWELRELVKYYTARVEMLKSEKGL